MTLELFSYCTSSSVKELIHRLSNLSNDSIDVSQQSSSRPHIIPHLLRTQVDLQTENNCVVVTSQLVSKCIMSLHYF